MDDGILTALLEDPSPELATAFKLLATADNKHKQLEGDLKMLNARLADYVREAAAAETSFKDASAAKSAVLVSVAIGKASKADLTEATQTESEASARKNDLAAIISALREAIPTAQHKLTDFRSNHRAAREGVYRAMYKDFQGKVVTPELTGRMAMLTRLKARAQGMSGVPDDFFKLLLEIKPDPTPALDQEVNAFIDDQVAGRSAPGDQMEE